MVFGDRLRREDTGGLHFTRHRWIYGKIIGLRVFNLLKQAWLLPTAVLIAFEQRRQRVAQREFETERLEPDTEPGETMQKGKLAATLTLFHSHGEPPGGFSTP